MLPKVEPNFFELAVDGVHITYAVTSIDAEERLSYRDPGQPQFSKDFSTLDIRVEHSAIGKLLSVFLEKRLDSGYISLTLVLPNVELAGEAKQPFKTFAVITTHLYNVQPGLKGAREIYQLLELEGTARLAVL